MIAIAYTLILLGLILLPLAESARRKNRPVVYKIDRDTSNANYAVNEQGFLEEIGGKKVHQHIVD